MTRYGNQVNSKCSYGGTHRSLLEAAVCQIIWLREKAGEIQHVQHEVHLYLSDARIGYIVDFRCKDLKTGEDLYIEAKGFANDRWPILKKLYQFYGPGTLEIWKGSHRGPTLAETIVPVRTYK